MCKLTNRELEQRLVVSERNSYKSEEKNFDSYLKEINSKHKREVADFQKEAKLLSNKLMSKVSYSSFCLASKSHGSR